MQEQYNSNNEERLIIKNEILHRIDILGLEQSLFPFSNRDIDELVQKLENFNFLIKTFGLNYSSLEGDWELIYASQGTVVTRQFVSILPIFKEIKIKRIWQRLLDNDSKSILTSNIADFDIPFLGNWHLQADGLWKFEDDEYKAKVSFNSFSMTVTQAFGQSYWNLPELKIPILEIFQKEALWITSYLDEEIRVGRGVSGNLFVFKRI